MESKQKKMALIFAMTFIATITIFSLFSFDQGIEGQAIKEFNSIKEKTEYCNSFCDDAINEGNPDYSSWTDCHEDCVKN